MKVKPITQLLLAVFCLLPLAAQLQNREAKPSWKLYLFNKDHFAMEFPVVPNPHQDSQVKEMTAYSAVLEIGAGFTLHVGPRPPDCAGVLDRLRSGALNDQNNKLDSQTMKTVVQQSYGGFEFEWTSTSRRGYTRYVCGPERVYAFTGSWPREKSRPQDLDRMVKSFRILSDATQ